MFCWIGVYKGQFTLHWQMQTNADSHPIYSRLCHFSDIPRTDKCRFNLFNRRKQVLAKATEVTQVHQMNVSFAVRLRLFVQCE